ncbi:MAG: OmpA family protein [Flavobacteriales bacterium]
MRVLKNELKSLVLGVTFLKAFFGFSASQPPPNSVIYGDNQFFFEIKDVFEINQNKYDEFSPVVYGDKLIFVSNREFDARLYGENNWQKKKYYNLFVVDVKAHKDDTLAHRNPRIFSSNLFTGSHSGPLSFNKERKKGVVSMVNPKDYKGKGKLIQKPQLYEFEITDGKISDYKVVSFCSLDHAYGHPAISADGNTLYFVAELPGGKGGKDVWMSTKQENGWSSPVNLGESINSSSNEMFPYVINDRLFFSSDRKGGMGGLDIYLATRKGNDWAGAINLGESINSAQDDFGVTFLSNGKAGYFSSNRNGSDDIFYFDMTESRVVRNEITGQFNYRNLKGNAAGLEVLIFDEDGNIVQRATTDKDGKFIFANLSPDKKYTIKYTGNQDVELVLFGRYSNVFLLSNSEGEFVYRRLKNDHVVTLSLIAQEDIDVETNTANLRGQFIYEHLYAKYPKDIEVMLIDENGNIAFKTVSDKHGNFEFKNLPMDKNFTIKTTGLENEDVSLIIYNKKDQVEAFLMKNKNGEFVYRRLKSDGKGTINLLTLDDDAKLDFASRSLTVFGKFDRSDKKAIQSEIFFSVLDENENLIVSSSSDKNGYFRLVNLPLKEKLIFKLDADNQELFSSLILEILNKTQEVVVVLQKDGRGFFVYRRLDSDMANLVQQEEKEETLDSKHYNEEVKVMDKIPTLLYDNNAFKVDAKIKVELDKVIAAMKKDENLIVIVESHTSEKGSEEYNMKLSKQRVDEIAQYMMKNGISSNRIRKFHYGKSRLKVKCPDSGDCQESIQAQNRRSELRFVK